MHSTDNSYNGLCSCHEIPVDHTIFSSSFIGVDESEGRFGEVTLLSCNICRNSWVQYFYEVEAYTASGRWYRAWVDPLFLPELNESNTLSYIENSRRYIYGGSYFDSTGEYGSGKIR